MKKILITGASKGIGLETAKLFSKNGFETIICASSEESISKVRSNFPKIHSYVCDMSNKDKIELFLSEIIQKFGKIDILVNNVGKFIPGQINKEEDGVFEKLMQTNLFSAYYTTKILLPKMMEEKNGTIFNICSIASITPYPNGGSYSISKYALLGFSKVLREEMKPYNIRVISVLPGATLTASWEGVDLPPERFIPPEDIAKTIWDTYHLSSRTVVEEILIRPIEGDI